MMKKKEKRTLEKNSQENMRKKERKLCMITLIMKKSILQKRKTKGKNGKCDNLNDYEKEQLRKYKRKGRKVMFNSLGDDGKEE